MKKQISIVVSAVLLLGILGGLVVWRMQSSVQQVTTTENSKKGADAIEKPADVDICNAISTEEMQDIFGVSYKKPNITKAAVSTGLSSDTCSFRADSGKAEDAMQLVVRYANTSATNLMQETWDGQTKNLANKTEIKSLGKEAFLSGNTLYVLFADNFITLTKSNASADQLKRVVEAI